MSFSSPVRTKKMLRIRNLVLLSLAICATQLFCTTAHAQRNALTYQPGKNVGWYLSRAGGPTHLADKKAIFVIHSNGSVTGGGQGSYWTGSVLSGGIGPGDTVVVPEKPIGGGTAWKNVVSIAQIAQAAALAAAVAIP